MSTKLKNISSPLPPQNELLFRVIKIIDIAYITVLFFIFAYIFGGYINSFFVYIYGIDYEKKSNFILTLEILSQIIFIGIVCYIGRNLIEYIPFPLDGINGFVHKRVKELGSGAFITVFLVMFQYDMQEKITFIKNRVKEEKNKLVKNS
jgi:hypothetical protein